MGHGATTTSRSAGSSAGTSASSTSSGTTAGYSATATAAPAWSSSPGRTSNGRCRSRAPHLPMTPPWPATGPNGARGPAPAGQLHLAPAPRQEGHCPLCGDHLLSPTSHPSPPGNGNNGGCTRWAIATSYLTHDGDPAPPRTRPASCTHPASARSPASTGNQHFSPHTSSGLLEPCARQRARTVLRGRGRGNALPLPGKTAVPRAGLFVRRAALICAPRVWPGVRRAGVPKAEPGADAGPAAPQAPLLIIITGDFGNASRQAAAIAISRWSAGWYPLPW